VQSQKHKYPGDYVLQYIEGDGKTFDYGIDFLECANCKFLRTMGADELAPYVCAGDKLVSEFLGWGLTRTMTIADGHEKCDFRFKRGGETHVQIPSSLHRTKRSPS
jgi:predicted ArsR family transcriptional regulator